MIKFRCHKCDKKIGVQDVYAGRRVWCPRCGFPTPIPESDHGETDMGKAKESTQYSVVINHSVVNEEAVVDEEGISRRMRLMRG